jgi:2-polyprenyl-6-methoxyphenol hydroxylase-like FAD-dependent oxidoreductase
VLSPSRVFAELGTTEPAGEPRRVMGRAVVLGGSMAGLLAARVLSDHADEVVVIERDDVAAAGSEARPGVPQGSHVHALLPSGQLQLERWFPGFADEAVAAGAVVPDAAAIRHYANGSLRRYANDIGIRGRALSATRPFLEGLVRARVARLPNVQIVHGRAAGLVLAEGRVTGVRYHPDAAPEPGAAPDGETRTEPADLVVDAMGRSSRLGDWLTEHGLPAPPMRRMPIRLTYATALFRRDPRISDVDVVFSQALPAPGRVARIGAITPVEGDRWIMVVAGYDDDRPSRDPADFTTRCRRDFPAEFGDIAEHGERLGDVMTYHQADSRRRDFHELDELPAGLVAVGDAVASFNPVYGQGMASASLHASALSAYLRDDPRLDEPATAYFAKVRVVVDAAWQTSTTADLALPHIDGPYPPGYRLIAGAANLIFMTSADDRELNERLSMVTTMLAHPNSLARPDVLLRAALARLRRPAPAPA